MQKLLDLFIQDADGIQEPFRFESAIGVYNGGLLILFSSVPRERPYSDCPQLPEGDPLGKRIRLLKSRKYEHTSVSPQDFQPKTMGCSFCDGKGNAFFCPECEGSSNLVINYRSPYSGNHEVVLKCPLCLQAGQLARAHPEDAHPREIFCTHCVSGKIFTGTTSVVGDVQYSVNDLRLLFHLSDVKLYRPEAPASGRSPSYFTFSGGQGWLAPVIEEEFLYREDKPSWKFRIILAAIIFACLYYIYSLF